MDKLNKKCRVCEKDMKGRNAVYCSKACTKVGTRLKAYKFMNDHFSHTNKTKKP